MSSANDHSIHSQITDKIDGRESIERQIKLHVEDLFPLKRDLAHRKPEILDQIISILKALQYNMDRYIRGGQMPNLDEDICKAVADALLMLVPSRIGFLHRKPAPESLLAVKLFADFLGEVHEFSVVVSSSFNVSDLERKLNIHELILGEEEETGFYLLFKLVSLFNGEDWQHFIDPSHQKAVAKVLEAKKLIDKNGILAAALEASQLPSSPKACLFPPQNLSFDRNGSRVMQMFRVHNVKEGLSPAQVQENLQHYGPNVLPRAKLENPFKIFISQFKDFMILTMIVSIVVLAVIDGKLSISLLLLFVVVVFNVAVGFKQDYSASKTLESLLALSSCQSKAVVRRGGKEEEIESSLLVPGDVVVLKEGDQVPADLRLVECTQLEIVEAILTGESAPSRKETKRIRAPSRRHPLSECKGNAFMGTAVCKGSGVGIVVRTGKCTEMGKISHSLAANASNAELTPLQKHLENLGKILVAVASVLCLIIGAIRWIEAKPEQKKQAVKDAIILAVSVIPEGLVAVVSVTRQMAISRLKKKHVLVTRMAAAETLGSVTIICTDKTGTCTLGVMTLQETWTFCDKSIGDFSLYSCMFLCNNAAVNIDGKASGDSTEIALKLGAIQAGYTKDQYEAFCGKVNEFAFTSERKMMSCIYKCLYQPADHFGFVVVKGAPESLLTKCTHFLCNEDEHSQLTTDIRGTSIPIQQMNEERAKQIFIQNHQMASQGLRVLGMAYKIVLSEEAEWKEMNSTEDPDSAESNLIFIGLAGVIDPPRPGVKESVRECRGAGIRVCMITGDQLETAKAVAGALEIYSPTDAQRNVCMLGMELDQKDPEEISRLFPFPVVFARVSPEHKLAIVKGLQMRRIHCVAMTGDGVNDAPAIKQADVGVAMGVTGTEITKQAADVILLNDDFTSIVVGIREGRRVFDSICKFLVYLLACNFAEIIVAFSAVFRPGQHAPLTENAILLANIFADIPPSLSLGFEPAEPGIMRRRPRDPNAGVLNWDTFSILITESVAIAVLTLVNFNFRGITIEQRQTFAYATISILQIFLSLLSKSTTLGVLQVDFFDNLWLIASFFFSSFLIIGSIYVKGLLGSKFDILEMDSFPAKYWILIGVECAVLFVIVEVSKWILRAVQRRRSVRL